LWRSRSAFLIVLVGTCVAPAHAWVPVGPPGGDVRALASDPRNPQILYLGTADGILYRSQDQGLHWRRSEPGFPTRGMSLDKIIVDSRGVLFIGYWQVGGRGGGVARSSDGGQNFEMLPDIDGESVRALAFAEGPHVLVAGAISGVFRSVDGGHSWKRISPKGHSDLHNVESLAIDPSDPDVIWVGTWHLPWKTVDGGKTWRQAHTGLIDDSDIFTLTLDHKSRGTLYATACTGVYRSSDGGNRWAKLRGIPESSRRTRAFAQDRDDPGRLYAGTTQGLWGSETGGGSWSLLTSKELVVNALLLMPQGTVLLGTEGTGVLRSTDGGRSWSASNSGFSERFASRVLFDPPGGRILVGVLGDRHFGGVLWAPGPEGPWAALGGGLEGREVLGLSVAGRNVLAGTDDGLFLWTPEIARWRRLKVLVDGLEAHARATEVLSLSERVFLAATSSGLLRSTDGGESWHKELLGAAASVEAIATSGGSPAFALAATALGIYRSLDGGATWERISMGPPEARIHALAVLPSAKGVLFATTPTGLFKSADEGRTWSRRGGGLPLSDITAFTIDRDGRTIFASDFAQGGLFQSKDAGETWSRFPTDGLVSDRVWTLAIDPVSTGRLIAATPAGGLHLYSGSSETAGSP